MSSSADVIIRKARPEDYEDLLEIGDVYWGKDYFKAQYHSYFKDPNIHPLVAEVNGKAVGYYMSHIIDNGQTLIKRAGRVHPSFRGHGIFHQLSEALDKHWKEFHPNIKYETFGTTDKADKAKNEFQEKGFTEVLRKGVVHLIVRPKDLKGLDEDVENVKRVTRMTYDDFKLLFADNDLITRLLPKGILFNWYVGFRMHESNIKYMINDNEFVMASTSSTSTSPVPSGEISGQHNFSPESINKINILSCVRKLEATIGLIYGIDFYTADGYDESMIKAHLIYHFNVFRNSTNKDGITMLSFNSNLKEELLLSCLKEIGIVDHDDEMEVAKVLYEKKF